MSVPSSLFDSALSLPPAERANLALQLLRSLELPGEEVPAEVFAEQLRGRVEKHRCGELGSVPLQEARKLIERKLADGSNG